MIRFWKKIKFAFWLYKKIKGKHAEEILIFLEETKLNLEHQK